MKVFTTKNHDVIYLENKEDVLKLKECLKYNRNGGIVFFGKTNPTQVEYNRMLNKIKKL